MRSLLVFLFALVLAGCGPQPPVRQESYVFGTRVEVQVQGVPEAQAHAAAAAVLQEFDRLHRTYHAWQPSELSALNEAIAAGKPHRVSTELAGFIKEAQTLAVAGDYLFDPGLGRLIKLWGFHTDEIAPTVPDAAELARLLASKPSIAQIRIKDLTVTSSNRAVALDFGGYLKGVALDRAAMLLREKGVKNALINIGGNILALGSKGDRPWRVGIQHPRPETVGGTPLASLELHDGEAIGTSGDYHRYFMRDGRRYCHLIDPRTGQPAEGTQALTILIPPGPQAGMRSDALSKPVFIAGDAWREMARKLEVAAVLKVGAGGTGRPSDRRWPEEATALVTPAMKARLTIEVPDLKLSVSE